MCLKHAKVVAIGSDLHERDERAIRCFEKAEKKLAHRIDEIWQASEALLKGAIPLSK
jgi:hypothetical protein